MSALALALLIPATASAAARFASPTGTGTACTQSTPCDIVTAVNSATANGDVTIEPGTYGSPTPLTTDLSDSGNTLTIHGAAGQPRPVIDTTAQYGFDLGNGSSLSDVDVEDASTAFRAAGIWAVGTDPVTIDHVVSDVTGPTSVACYPNGTITNSVCWAQGASGYAGWSLIVNSVTATYRNDTLIASGSGGYGAVIAAGGSGVTMEMDAFNTIIRGGGADVYIQATAGATATFTAHNSDYATIDNVGGGGMINVTAAGPPANTSGAPAFVNAATGNFHELASSPTVDAGADSPLNGTTDLDGTQRDVGVHTDIGAYEFVPAPSCSNLSASTKFGTATTIQLHCGDLAGAPLSYAISRPPVYGRVTVDASTGLATYTPTPGYSGPDSFTYTGTSSHGASTASTVILMVGKEAQPVILGLSRKGRTLTFTLNEPAQVTLTLARKHHKALKLTRSGNAGSNQIRLSKKLAAGKYKATLVASNAGGKSKSRRIKFKISP